MNRKYQVFISSTYTDLKEERSKVRDAILSMYHFPVGMELFGAANEEQWQIISETIDSSDYYVLILGQRYGSVIAEGLPDAGISYTEKEFRYALEKGIPILAFLIDDNVPVLPENVERDNPCKLEAFKDFVKMGRLVEWWKTPDELAQKVTASLFKQITRTKRPGWIRSDAVDIEKCLHTMTELAERNQQLTDENKALVLENQQLKQITARNPKLIVALEGDKPEKDAHYDLLYSRSENIQTDESEVVHLKVGNVSTTLVKLEYQPVSKADFSGDLLGMVTDEEIKAYNDALPSPKELEEYLNLYSMYHMIADCGIATIVTVHNIGTAKANDVSVLIEFPDEIIALAIKDVRELEEPQAPEKPRDLREIAYERVHIVETTATKAFAQLDQYGLGKAYNWPSLSAYITGNNSFDQIEIEDNTVSIETSRGIVHTKWECFDGLYLVPVKRGTFKAKVTLMCAEYRDPEETELTFICE